MKAEDLNVGDNVIYRDDCERCLATVLRVNLINKTVRFKDWDEFEWDERFEEIPETVLRIIR